MDRSGHYEIWTINADGTNLRQLSFNSPGDASFPLWSPDGARILFQQDQVNVILDLNKDWTSQTLQQLPKPDKVFVAWDWSLDGKKLIGTFRGGRVGYFSFETNQYEIVSSMGAFPMWLPDSLRFVCLSGDQAYLGDISSKEVREIFSLRDAELRGLAISADARLIYFSAYSTESDIWMLDLP